MVAWALVAIVFSGTGIVTRPFGVFMNMDECFVARDLLIANGPKPKINYEVICVRVDGQPLS